MISIKSKGNFDKTNKFFKRMSDAKYLSILDKFGAEGVKALSLATPKDSSLTANSWSYEVRRWNKSTSSGATITWKNSNNVNGIPIAILLQYGHGTQNGSYVVGRDYINPALKPIFDKMANDVWKEVTKQ